MYGTIARMRAKPGRQDAVVEHMEEWNRTRRPDVKGVVGGYLLRPDTKPDELIMVAIFEDKQTYEANAGDPAQDRWYRRLREDLQDDPAWEDGEFLVG